MAAAEAASDAAALVVSSGDPRPASRRPLKSAWVSPGAAAISAGVRGASGTGVALGSVHCAVGGDPEVRVDSVLPADEPAELAQGAGDGGIGGVRRRRACGEQGRGEQGGAGG